MAHNCKYLLRITCRKFGLILGILWAFLPCKFQNIPTVKFFAADTNGINLWKYVKFFFFPLSATIFQPTYDPNLPNNYPKMHHFSEHAQTQKAPTEVGAFIMLL